MFNAFVLHNILLSFLPFVAVCFDHTKLKNSHKAKFSYSRIYLIYFFLDLSQCLPHQSSFALLSSITVPFLSKLHLHRLVCFLPHVVSYGFIPYRPIIDRFWCRNKNGFFHLLIRLSNQSTYFNSSKYG